MISVAFTPVLATPGLAATPFSFAVIGDIPYGATQLSMFPQRIAQINGDPDVQMVTHLGDIGGPPNCADSYYATIKSNFDQFADPFLYTPGDNEWADCSGASIGAANPLNRLAAVRQVFFPQPGRTLGANPATVTAQPDYPENVLLTQEGITFAMVHIVGSENDLALWKGNSSVRPEQKAEVDARNIADISLIQSAFATAKANNSRAVALLTQADMFNGSPNRTAFSPLVQAIATEAAAYGKPVFLFNGDTHSFASDKPLNSATWLSYYGITTAVPNLSRITIQGGANVAEWLKVTVVSTAEVLKVQRVPYTSVVVPVASFTSTTSSLTASFDASGSTGAGGVSGYAWTFGDGSTGTGVAPSHTYVAAGTFAVSLKVTDAQGAAATSTGSVTVTSAATGTDSVVVPAKSAWKWRFTTTAPDAAWKNPGYDASAWKTGPGTLGYGSTGIATNIDISGAASTRPLAAYFIKTFALNSASAVTKLSLQTVADDGVVVYVNGKEVGRSNMPAGAVTLNTYATSSINTTAATASPVVIDVPVSLLVNGANTIAAETHLNYHAAPNVSFDLTATATTTSGGGGGPAPNQAPTAKFSKGVAGLTASLDGSASSDPDGSIATYAWDFGDQTNGTGPTAAHTYATAGTYTVTLKVTDDKGATGVSSALVTVTAPSTGPVSTEVVPAKSAWNWRYASTAPPASWKNKGFDASSWNVGPGTLGFGATGLGTNIDVAGPASSRPLAAYFIRNFNLDAASNVAKLSLRTIANDGVVVYVNGTEVVRGSMPAGPVSFGTYASSGFSATKAGLTPVTVDVPLSLLVDGVNTIAVETHLNYHATADVTFDLTAVATTN